MDAARPPAGDAAPPARESPIPTPMVLCARAALVVALASGALVLHRGTLPPFVRAIPLGAAVAYGALSAYRRGRPVPAVAQVATVGAVIVAGIALGSGGRPEVAVAASIAVALVGSAEGMVADGMAPVGAAAGAAIIGAAAAGRVHAGSMVATACVTVVGVWAVWVGRLIADAQGAGDLERTELIRLRTEMVTTVSHELRTPLTVIQGATATLTRRWDVLTEPERLDLIDVLTENVASLDASILHFVDAARLERGGVVLTPEWVDVAAAIDAASARRNAALAGHEVRRELAVGVVWADRTALERMLEHLLMNAARFSSIGLPITVRTSGTAAEATISVLDKGQGIPPHLQRVIWEPLRRGDVGETGVSRGAGLGLPIVRELARLHGGDATLASVKGRGTSVTVTLPQPAAPVLQPVRGRAASRRRAG